MNFFKKLFSSKSTPKKNTAEQQITELVSEIFSKPFIPNEESDIKDGTIEVSHILQNKVTERTAREIYQFAVSRTINLKAEERTANTLKQELENKYPNTFSVKENQLLFDYISMKAFGALLGGKKPQRMPNGSYGF